MLAHDAEGLLRDYTHVQPAPMVPEIRLYLADQLVPLWLATERQAGAPQPPPFWAFAWPGSIALARYLLDHPRSIRRKTVLDLGSGAGLAAIAAAMAGASEVVACDLDPRATFVQTRNAALNGVSITPLTGDALSHGSAVEVVVAGDVFYERETAAATIAWLRHQATNGTAVLVADPGRHYAPSRGLDLITTYDVPVLMELESVDRKRTRLWRLRP